MKNERTILKLALKTPISNEVVNMLITQILNKKDHNFLLINFGDHDFESIAVIKYCREQLETIKQDLLAFEKIAMVHPPDYENESEDNLKLRYFTSEQDAVNWLLR
ncbi:MAG: hypothetical protein DWQ02_25250 [Bacteroidetes bacterium]|nr:MAG: hypothetical protein DWQ02_25250 [Bacteroidota bacterium]